MYVHNEPDQLRAAERMLIREIDRNGHLMVRSLDRIHARTGITYVTISEMATQLEKHSYS